MKQSSFSRCDSAGIRYADDIASPSKENPHACAL
jgi:hypothetical protein